MNLGTLQSTNHQAVCVIPRHRAITQCVIPHYQAVCVIPRHHAITQCVIPHYQAVIHHATMQ